MATDKEELRNKQHITRITRLLVGSSNLEILQEQAKELNEDFEQLAMDAMLESIYNSPISQGVKENSEALLYGNVNDMVEILEDMDVVESFESFFDVELEEI